ncbi:hypothetical protein QTG56_19510 [Rossellomorea sp. AcN35-11]|nr:hypothetical protein [Rossellomorea aquimaris]NMH71442.1 hypothetical protein [Bacillus sp. RO3]WJV29143.1 hypothetical protein QTG56_19510 [Rossellomorea sp. AcN35-11]
MVFEGCVYCGNNSLTEMELLMREQYEEVHHLMFPHGQKIGGNVVLYGCDHCGYLHPFHKEKRRKYGKKSTERTKGVRWNIR